MTRLLATVSIPIAVLFAATPALAVPSETVQVEPRRDFGDVPRQLSDNDLARYRAVFAAIKTSRWSDAKARIAALDESDPLRAFARAELYLAKDSPRVELFDLLDLIAKASWLPQAEQLSRLAQKRGAQTLPELPQVQKLVWLGSAPRREQAASVSADFAARALGTQVLPFIKGDNPAGAEALLNQAEPTLSPAGLTEWRERIAWSYYIENDDANARRLATRALETGAAGDWRVQSFWTIGLASWRQQDCKAAASAFANVGALAGNADMRAAGAYWASRAYMVCGEPAKVENLLRAAARYGDTFYGLMARETLGMPLVASTSTRFDSDDWRSLRDKPAVQVAVAFAEMGDGALADKALRHEARIGGAAEYKPLVRLASALDMPSTQLWLAHNGPAGQQPDSASRFPTPSWKPEGGWRVDPALVYAHMLQESNFRPDAVSGAGARGLMQVRPGTAGDLADSAVSVADLHAPSVNIEYGQRYLEKLRDMNATGGLLPKVMAAYNAGPLPVERWNSEVRDGGDPLLFMESLPYWETRAYVNIVMRNYWMYQIQAKGRTDCLTGMAQGLWPRFPGTKGTTLVRITANGSVKSGGAALGTD